MSHEQSVIREPDAFSTRFWAAAALVIILALAFAPAQAAAKSLKIVMLGDSLTAGYGLPPSQALPVRLQTALKQNGYDAEIINAGVSGDTTAGGLARLDWSVPDDADGVIVELGANDALRGLPAANARKNLDAILTRLGQRKIPVLLTGMLAPLNMGETYRAEFAAIFPDLSRKHRVPLYPFFLDGVAANAELNQADGKHPNGKGVDVLVQRLTPVVGKWLNAVKRTQAGSG